MQAFNLKRLAVGVTLALALTGCNSSSDDKSSGIPFNPADYLLINDPYLMSAQDDSIVVSWRTDVGSESKVLLGSEPGHYTDEIFGESQRLGYQYHYHMATLGGLKAGKKYYYRVITDNTASEEFSFVAAPDEHKQGNFRFVVIGDHQYAEDDRIDRLVKGARHVLETQYPQEGVHAASMVLNNGDQVDRSTLQDYQDTHFGKMKYLSGELPFYTALGNHEYYQDPNASLYFAHFKYDHLDYQGIQPLPQHLEEYYAFKKGRVLFVMLNTEVKLSNMTGDEMVRQGQWVKELVETADQDDSIDWIFAVGHHPLRSELGQGDEEELVERVYTAELNKSDKFAMYIGAHTHNYARGTFRDHSGYHLISGGASFDEYWTKRADDPSDYEALVNHSAVNDYPDVSRTQQVHNFQLVDIDLATDEVIIQTWSTGNVVNPSDEPFLLDEFRLNKEGIGPDTPSINLSSTSLDMSSDTLEISLSDYHSMVGAEMFSTEFVIGKLNPYTTQCEVHTAELNVKHDIENIFGAEADEDWFGIDRNKDHDISKLFIGVDHDFYIDYELPNGEFCVMGRYRDEMQRWSGWSAPETIEVHNSEMVAQDFGPTISISLDDELLAAQSSVVEAEPVISGEFEIVDDQERGRVLHTGFDGETKITYFPTDEESESPNDWLGNDQITFSLWLKPNTIGDWGCYMGNGQRTKSGFCLGTRQRTMWATGIAAERAETGEHEGFTYLRATEDFAETGVWSHLVTTYDNRMVRLYLNGELIAEDEKGAELKWDVTTNGNVFNLASAWSDSDGNIERYFQGYMSDAQVWDRALSPDEIEAIYQQQK
ncbi:LamG-like jellyroll fold domain-containing protein [Vibrio sp. WXL103]|uniref:LamG-like jellyroll fold domain-containing protein n=1 Tax=Vibrio sp. WXL103 TaxID=3450710 RepID=UPI003EC51790